MNTFFLTLCLGVLAVQALPQIKAPIDDIVRELEDLNRDVIVLEAQSIDQLAGELRSLDELSQNLLRQTGEELRRDSEQLVGEIRELEQRARQYRVDISECVGDSVDEINGLPDQLVGEAGICINLGHAQAQRAVDDGYVKIERAVGPIDEYWREVERCREAGPRDQEVCVAALTTEIRNDGVLIPSKIRLALEETLGHLEAEKPTLLLCTSDKEVRLNEEAGRVVRRVTECAERLFPPFPPTH
jgi:archaellum component FlaC